LLKKVNRWICERYGGRRGLFLSLWHRMWFFTGRYHGYRCVNWNNVDRLIFVCTGNICRSPFAEIVARSKGLKSISCGTDAGSSVPANTDAVAAAMRKGVDLTGHKSRPVASLRLNKGDLFVVMEPCQGDYLKTRYGKQVACTLIGVWRDRSLPYLHDPYGNSSGYFDRCFEVIEESVEGILREIKRTKEY